MLGGEEGRDRQQADAPGMAAVGGILPALDFKAPQQQVRAAQPTHRPERRGRNGPTEAFVKTFKRDYTLLSPRPNADAVLRKLDEWFTH